MTQTRAPILDASAIIFDVDGTSEKSLRDAGAVDVYRDPSHLLEALEAAA